MDEKQLKRLKDLGKTYKDEWDFLCGKRVWMDNILEQDPADLAVLAVMLIASKREVKTWKDFLKIREHLKEEKEVKDYEDGTGGKSY